jgi:hypothetical protein
MRASNGIPVQKKGSSSDTFHTVELHDEKQAIERYELAKNRLLDVNEWEKLAGTGSADFTLTNDKGDPVSRPVQVNDYFRIDIPGPGTITGEGYDWVHVEAIEEKEEQGEVCVYLKVRPASNPLNADNSVAHFFDDAATSTFVVCRDGNAVIASVHGRNEKPNTQADNLIDKARNAVTALTATAAFSKIQWKKLLEGLVE